MRGGSLTAGGAGATNSAGRGVAGGDFSAANPLLASCQACFPHKASHLGRTHPRQEALGGERHSLQAGGSRREGRMADLLSGFGEAAAAAKRDYVCEPRLGAPPALALAPPAGPRPPPPRPRPTPGRRFAASPPARPAGRGGRDRGWAAPESARMGRQSPAGARRGPRRRPVHPPERRVPWGGVGLGLPKVLGAPPPPPPPRRDPGPPPGRGAGGDAGTAGPRGRSAPGGPAPPPHWPRRGIKVGRSPTGRAASLRGPASGTGG